MAATSAILVGCALVPHPPLWWLYVAAGITAALSGVELPTRSAMVPNMVGADVLPAALSINQLMWNTAWVAGPLMAGAVISAFGFAWAYALDVVTYAATFVAALLTQPHPPPPRAEGTAGCLGPPRDRRC